MSIRKEWMPQFRDAEESGRIGVRGAMGYFQDIASSYWYEKGKGNDVIAEKYGISWVYTKYRVHIEKQADFSEPLKIESWVENIRNHFLVTQGMKIYQKDTLIVSGILESCLMNLSKGILCKTTQIEVPEGLEEDNDLNLEPFRKLVKTIDGMQYVYTHEVRYTQLDKSHHMSNLYYVNLILNVFDSKFYRERRITDFEIHYTAQTFEKDKIRMYVRKEENEYYVSGQNEEGTVVVTSWLRTACRMEG